MLLSVRRSISFSKHRLQISLQLIEIEALWSWSVSWIIRSRNRLKIYGQGRNQYLALVVDFVAEENYAGGMFIEGLDELNEPFFDDEHFDYLLEAFMRYLIKCLLEINEIVEQVPLDVHMFLDGDPSVEELFHSTPSSSQTCLLFWLYSLSRGFQTTENNIPCWDGRWYLIFYILVLSKIALFDFYVTSNCVHSFDHFFCFQIRCHRAVKAMTVFFTCIFLLQHGGYQKSTKFL